MADKLARLLWAQTHNNEKQGGEAVRRHWLQCNGLEAVRLNGQSMPVFSGSAGMVIDGRDISSVEHPCIVMVENLTIMAALELVDWPEPLSQALFVYRGDAKAVSTSAAYEFCRAQSLPVFVFADFDPKGLEIALTSGAEAALLPQQASWSDICDPQWQGLIGAELRWDDQTDARSAIARRADKPLWLDSAMQVMGRNRQTRTQEHLIAHQVPLALFPL